jgi:hypothetical protein
MSSPTAVEDVVHALREAWRASATKCVDPHHELTPEQSQHSRELIAMPGWIGLPAADPNVP